ncbi:hypothetical protein HWV62_24684 [Athelia sp. TMB]|nr:hypothetical protein HWV62_24684 [Athelia sp. TMB]
MREAGYHEKARIIEPVKDSRPPSVHTTTSSQSYHRHDFVRKSFSHPGSQRSPTTPRTPGLFSYPEPPQDQEYEIALYEAEDPPKARFSEQVEDINGQDMPWSESSHASHNSIRPPRMALHHRRPIPSSNLFDGSDDGHPYRGMP